MLPEVNKLRNIHQALRANNCQLRVPLIMQHWLMMVSYYLGCHNV